MIEHQILEKIFQHSLDAMIISNENEEIILINKAAEDLFKLEKSYIGKNINQLFPEGIYEQGDSKIELFSPSLFLNKVKKIRAKKLDNTYFWAEVTASKMEENGKLYINSIIRDITSTAQTADVLFDSYQINQITTEIMHLALNNHNNLKEVMLETTKLLKELLPERENILKISIFLNDDNSNILELFAEQNIQDSQTPESCKYVKFGECLCGTAAITQKQINKPHIDNEHTLQQDKNHKHGHSIHPIVCNKKTLGVLNIYTKDGTQPKDKTIMFYQQAANVIGELISRIKIQKEMENYKFALNNTAAVSMTDAKGEIIFVNDSFTLMSRYSMADLLGKNHRILNSNHHSADFWNNLWETIYSGRIWNGEIKNLKKNGKTFWTNTTIVPQLAGERRPQKYISISFDITKQKEAEMSLLLTQKELEESIKSKKSFLSIMSHELRTPLTSIMGMTDLLNNKSNINDAEFIISKVKKAAGSLLYLINSIIDISLAEENKLQLNIEENNINDVFNNCSHSFFDDAADKGLLFNLKITGRKSNYILCDIERIKQLLINLVSNSIKFTSRGSISVEINTSYIDKKNAMLKISIIDTGEGMEPEEVGMWLDKKEQLNEYNTMNYTGAGLGLSITKTALESMGGDISIESEKYVGTTILINIPVKIGKKIKKENKEKFKLNGNILYCEDVKDVQFFVQRMFLEWGIQLDLAEDGEECILRALEKKYDIILMDMMMPKVDGIEATQTISKLNDDTKIIGCSADTSNENKNNFLKAGAVDFVNKPIEKEKILQAILPFLEKIKTIEDEQNKEKTSTPPTQETNTTKDSEFNFIDDELMEVFLESFKERFEGIKNAMDKNEAEMLRKEAHALKGSGGTFGFDVVSKLSKDLEMIGKDGTITDAAGKIFNLLEKEFERIKKEYYI